MVTVELRKPTMALIWVLATVLWTTGAAKAQITSPGNHVHYAIDLEPHLVLQWSGEEGFDEGLGLGMRVSWPVIDNGPLPDVNNTLAVTAGADITFQGGRCPVPASNGLQWVDCEAWQLWLPVAAQWNFYFSQTFALFGELGLAIQYVNGEAYNAAGRKWDGDDIDIHPVLWLGGRYIATDKVAFTFRLGFPSLTVGASFFF